LIRKLLLFPLLLLAAVYTGYAQVPVANGVANPTSGCPPLAVSFTGSATGAGPFTWSWSFPGGVPATSTSQNVPVLYNNPGNYTATLIVRNASGNSLPFTIPITVNPIPSANFTQDKTNGCAPTWVHFTNTTVPGPGETITSYLWNFGDGFQDTVPSPSHRYTTSGNKNVTLYVNNNFGCTGKAQVKNVQQAIVLNGIIIPNFSSTLNSSCTLPVTANFSNTSTGPPILSWNWDFGDGGGFNNNLFQPTHPYTAAGNYNVRLAVTSNQGCSDTLAIPVNITANGNLTSFTVPDTVCINTTVNFTNISSPIPISSTWDYGDGSPPDIKKNGQHPYTTPGKFTVTLTNNFGGCSGTYSKDIYVVNPPTTDFSGTNLTSCTAPLTASFNDLSVGATSWSWDFGDGFTSNLKNPTHIYTTLGNYQVTLTTSSAGGCSSSMAKPGFVNVQAPSITLNNFPAYGCAPYTFTPAATVSSVDGVASYSWVFGNGNTSTSAIPPPQTYGAGTYTVTLSITTTGGCTAIASGQVQVGTTKPTAAFSFVPPSACVNQVVSFTDGSSAGTNQWLWSFGDGSTATNKNPTYAYMTPGSYNVRLTAYNNGCWDTISHTIVVNPPLADFKFSNVCGANNSFTFTDNSAGPVVTWLWDFQDGSPTVNVQNPGVHTFPAGPPKTYNVSLTVTNLGCSNTKTIPVTANQGTTVSFSANPVCANTPIFLTAIPSGNITNYTFVFGDGNSASGSSASIGYAYSKPGTYPVKVITTDINGCVDSSAVFPMVVNGPTVNFTAPPALTCSALTFSFKDLTTVYPAGASIVTWAWDFGDGGTSAVKNPTYTYTFPGTFVPNLTVTDNNGCTASLDSPKAITVSIPVAGFTVSEDSSCPNAPNPIRFTNNSTGGFNPIYKWTFGNGDSSSTFSPVYAYTTVGNFSAKLSMTDSYGCVSNFTLPKLITVDTPHASFTMSGNYSACPPFNDIFTFTGQYALTYSWDFTDGNGSTIKNPSNLFVNPGDYEPLLTITSHGGCTSIDSQHVHIDGPIGTFTYSPLAGCDSLDVVFNVTTTNVISFYWNFADNSPIDSTTTPTITHRYTVPGQYTPFVILTDAAGCKVPKIGTNAINVDAITKTIFKTDKAIVCDNGIVNFTDTSILGPNTTITSYTWDFGDGSPVVTGAFRTISHNYTTIGNYTATMSITSLGGCTGIYSMPITVAGSPNVAINGLINQCEPAVLTFSGTELVPDPNGPLTWSWSFGNGQTATGPNPAPVSYPIAGEYIVQLIATNTLGCKDTTDTTPPSHLFIYPIPTVNAGADVTICDTSLLPLNATGNAATYDWDPPVQGNLSCLACANPIASSPASTYFVVKGTSLQGCSAKDTIQVTVNTQVTVNASGTDSVCLGQSTPLNATGAAIYTWTPALGLSNPNIANPVATPDASQIGGAPSSVITYTVTGYDNKKCYSDSKSVDITAFNLPVISLTPNAMINVGSSYQINATVTTNIVSLNWTPSNTLSCANCLTPLATPMKTTKYDLTAINDGGCATTGSIQVQVICNGANFFVPNSFSPNGDGVNDHFIVNGVGLNTIPSITIYNRWGQIVFQKSNFAPNSASDAWDGTFNGQPAPSDVYIYTVQILCNNATLIPYHGNVTLIR
jgi:gliding motility-associated-like protein